MNTVSIVASISRSAGGLFQSVRRLHQSLAEIPGVRVTVFGLQDKFTEADLAAWPPLEVRAFASQGPRAFGYAPDMRKVVMERNDDILHTHGIWMYPSVVTRDWHRQNGRPYLVSTHGMLDPWAIKHSAWKKKLALFFYEREHLENAACLRALCDSEVQAMRAYGLKNPICILPNGVDLPTREKLKMEDNIPPGGIWPLASDRKTLLYLGRIHPKKGLANLLRAWAQVQKKTGQWILAIAGWDQSGHEDDLKKLATALRITWADARSRGGNDRGFSPSCSLIFTGPLFDRDKETAYAHCTAFVLPSFSEGLPMVILEAWAWGKPVLMTPECNLPEGFAANAAIQIDPSAESIAQGLEKLIHTSSVEISALGTNGYTLVAERFTWPKIAAEMKSVYAWVLSEGSKPGCIVD